MKKIIKITCKGSGVIPIDKLKDFQGNLKTLERDEFEKLKRSILKHGFSFPVFVWKNFLLDGHQRLFTVRELLKQGYTIADIPIVEVQAQDKAEAAEKLLRLNSHHAKITEDGLYEFLNEMSVDISGLVDDLTLPDIDMDRFLDGWVEDGKPITLTDDQQQENNSQDTGFVTCPKCGFEVKI